MFLVVIYTKPYQVNPFSLTDDINCTPDHSGLLNITIYNPGEPLSVNLTCSNGEFMFDMLTNEVVVQSAMFKEWTNQDLQHPENVCVLMVG